MRNIVYTLLLNTITIICNQKATADTAPRIIGGEDCWIKDYPFIVTIYHKDICGGSLVTLEWVLTAAHCLTKSLIEDNSTTVRAGYQDDDINPNASVQFRRGKEVVFSEKYAYYDLSPPYSELRYDIALLQVDTPFLQSEFVNTVALPRPGFTRTCKYGTALGIGVDQPIPFRQMSELDRPLKCVNLTIVDKKTCKKTWRNSVIDKSVVCTITTQGRKDTCKGDSGGPLLCKNIIIGIISMGKGCGNPNFASTYVSVEMYLAFISKTTGIKGNFSVGVGEKRSYATSDIGPALTTVVTGLRYVVMSFIQTAPVLKLLLLIQTIQIRFSLSKPRIVGGENCNVIDYPFVVSLNTGTLCGGTLIKLGWILTAAHCLEGPRAKPADQMQVRAGFDRHMNKDTVQLRYGKRHFVHKKFAYEAQDPPNPELRYDIGLLLLAKPFDRTEVIDTAVLPKPGFTEKCHTGRVLGVGSDLPSYYTKFMNTNPLKCAVLHIVNNKICAKTWPKSVFDDTILCTMEQVKDKDACRGDSGGPLVCDKVVIGIVSIGKGCGTANVSSVYTKTEKYLQFISSVTRNSTSCLICISNNFLEKVLLIITVIMCSQYH